LIRDILSQTVSQLVEKCRNWGKKYLPVKELMAVTSRIFTELIANLLQQAEILYTKFHFIFSNNM